MGSTGDPRISQFYQPYLYFKGEVIALVDEDTVPWRLITNIFVDVSWSILEEPLWLLRVVFM